jgi:hypothetical protein
MEADKVGRWLGEARARPMAEVAGVLGSKPGAHGKGWGPCPAWSTMTRGSTDKRGPVWLRPDGRGWSCYTCGAIGDGVTFVAYALGHGDRQGVAPVAAWLGKRKWVTDRQPTSASTPSTAPRPVVAPPWGVATTREVNAHQRADEVAAALDHAGSAGYARALSPPPRRPSGTRWRRRCRRLEPHRPAKGRP